ncbi:UDP-glycosyltransferase UGT4-like [Zophobas morio]|uniref:UDP-glycosyltransferase UGT4-like n=1 Tax=Zophobas morio TaxID=2755281 RepID=UPI0030831917
MYWLLLLVTVHSAASAKILAIAPTPLYSHQSVFRSIWSELSQRGHHVTLITTNPMKNPTLSNLTEIDISFTYKLVFEDHQMQHVVNTESNIVKLMAHVFFVMNNMTSEQLKHPQVEALVKSDDHFDLMVVEAHVPAWFGLAKKFNCPLIIVTSLPATNFFKGVVGNIHNLVYTHSFDLPFGEDLSFVQRVVCVLFGIFDAVHNRYLVYPFQERIIRETLGDEKIDLIEIVQNVSLMITNEIPGFSKVITHIPSMVHTNGLQIQPPQDLPSDLKQFLDEAPNGVIYVSLGSTVKSYLMSYEKKFVLFEVLGGLAYKVVWKLEEKVDQVPQNVKVVSWAPQQDILRHPNTKLFISQGGLQSIDEAIRFKVPILGIPFFGDQFYNSIRVKELKLGSWIELHTLTKEKLKEVILETVDNSTYLKNLEEMSGLMEHPLKSVDKAVWWIEYVIRHKGAIHLRSPLAGMPFYQYYLLDVGGFLLVIFIVGGFISLRLAKFAWKQFRQRTFTKVKLQ